MQDTLKAARVGALVVIALMAAFVVYRLVDESTSTSDGYRVHALFDDAQGLVTKSRVTIAGIPVGRIESIRLEGAQARVDIIMDGDVPLYEDASVRRISASLLGSYLLAIQPGTEAGHEALEDGDRIPTTEETASMGDIMGDVGAIARSVRAVATQLEHTFGTDEGGRQMAAALANLAEALEATNRIIQANEAVVNHTLRNIEDITSAAAPRLEDILANIEVITDDMRYLIEHNRDDLDQGVGEIDDTIASIHRASEELELVLADVGEITERTAAGEGTIGRLTSDEHLIDEVEEGVDSIGDILGTIGRLRTIVQLRSEYNFLANTFKNYVSIRLQPREGRYYLIELIDDPRGRTTFRTTQVRRSPPPAGEPEFYEETRVETEEALVFTLMLAQRVYFATFRFGILESSGGLGLDLHFFDDRLEFNIDIYQFGASQYPRLRARVAFEIVQSLFILGGVDDFLNERTVDIFLGAMLRFDDLDLAALFPFAGGALGGVAR